ncbi:DUF485 domain-containing protein [Bacillus xiapuensis]|uniref:DUF485 domain-containing protein n=1 Tax=Bacillus xiapuensis TaxID=2014075 RepID=UPI001E415B68|nr:DUF485 domain-containing protein [Bacillus xiapuensis]
MDQPMHKPVQTLHQPTKYEEMAKRPEFIQLVQAKKKFLVPLSVFFLVFYFALPLLTSYSTLLNAPAVGSISWVWVLAFSQFIMTWTLCMVYVKKASQFDKMAENIVKEERAPLKGELHK